MSTTRFTPGRIQRARLVEGIHRLFGDLPEERIETVLSKLEWLDLSRGDALVHEGEAGDSVYVLVAGRLRAVKTTEEGERVLGDIVPGESVGEMSYFTDDPRSATVYAVRDSDVVRISNDAFEDVLQSQPKIAMHFTRVLADRLKRQYTTQVPSPPHDIALVALTPGFDLTGFAGGLVEALGSDGGARALDSRTVDRALGGEGFAQAQDGDRLETLMHWLDDQEDTADQLLYVADPDATAWSQHCVDRADRVLLIAEAGDDPAIGSLERTLFPDDTPHVSAPRHTLVLVHEAESGLPTGTARWLDARKPDDHVHLRDLGATEMGRLARSLSGRSIGVVLGGGGARGWSHIGVLQAMEEVGIPVDRIGGTSMGAAMSAQYAMGWSREEMIERNRQAWLELAPHKEYTLPVFAVLRGRKAAIAANMLYGNTQVEDLWIPYYSVSTNITRAEQRVHQRGSLAMAVTASATLPGVLTPVIDGGDLLVDGGVLNNLPVDVMEESGAGRIIAVNVSGAQDLRFDAPMFPSPWQAVRNRMLRRPSLPGPRIGEVIIRCTMIGSAHQVPEAIKEADLYLRPPVTDIGLMDFESLDRAVELGYEYALEPLREWAERVEVGHSA